MALGFSAGALIVGGALAVGAVASASAAEDAEDQAYAQQQLQGRALSNNLEIARRQQTLAETQYADQQKLFEQYAPLLRQQFERGVAEQIKSGQRADDQWSNYIENFRPLENKLAQTAAEYDTAGRRESAARTASSGVGDQFAAARDQQQQGLWSAGVQPGSGKAAALDAASRIEEAKAKAGAENQARTDVETKGLALVDNAARFGRNMPSTGIAVAGLAGSQGQQASQQYQGIVNATAAPATAASGLFSAAAGTNSGSAGISRGITDSIFNSADRTQAAYSDILGSVAGAGGYFSSEKLKDIDGDVDGALEAVRKSPSKRWKYKGDDTTRIGPTAESFAEATGLGDGTKIDGISHLGLHHAAIGELAETVEGLAREVRGMKKGAPANDDKPGLASVKTRRSA